MRKGGFELRARHNNRPVYPGDTLRTSAGDIGVLVTGVPPKKPGGLFVSNTVLVKLGRTGPFLFHPNLWGLEWAPYHDNR